MARYYIPKPSLVKDTYLGLTATPGTPALIDVPDNHEPSVTWAPADEAGQKALIALGRKKAAAAVAHLDPSKDKFLIEKTTAEILKQYTKTIPEAPKPKRVPKEVSTNAEAAEGQGRKVVGREGAQSEEKPGEAGRNADKDPLSRK